MRLIRLGWLAAAILLSAGPAFAVPLGFSCVTGNSAGNCATGEAQFSVDVTDPGGGQVLFTFTNSGPNQSSITDIYFDDGTLIGISSIVNNPGVSFHQWANPYELPGANTLTPPFETTKGFSADADDILNLAVNPGESLGILFSLQPSRTYADTLAALRSGELRIGLQAMAFTADPQHACLDDGHPCGGQESFVNVPLAPVPEPPTLALLGSGFVLVGILGRRMRRADDRDRSRSR